MLIILAVVANLEKNIKKLSHYRFPLPPSSLHALADTKETKKYKKKLSHYSFPHPPSSLHALADTKGTGTSCKDDLSREFR
jgi:hypothetical protein